MYKSIYAHISDSMDDRATDIVNCIVQNSKDYIELTEKILQLQEEVKSYLTPDQKICFLDYEELLCERDSLKNLILYREGVIDGIRIQSLVHGIPRRKYKSL